MQAHPGISMGYESLTYHALILGDGSNACVSSLALWELESGLDGEEFKA